MISVDEAVRIVLEQIQPMGTERVPIPEVLGRVLAEDIVSRREHPPWDNSAMDGYAIRWEDVRTAAPETPVPLKVVGEIQAGRMPLHPVGPGEAIRIMTGAPIPDGVDGVVRVEDTEEAGEGVKIFRPCIKGGNIRFKGEDIHRGEQVIPKGSLGRPAEVGMLATAGYPSALVYRRPVVTVLATGDELVEPGEVLSEEKIVNSNSYSIAAQVRESGGIPVILEVGRDTRADLESKVRQSFMGDIAVVVGGISMGKYDFVKEVIQSIGCEMKFWQVAMRPGHPTAFGTLERSPGGLPGKTLLFGLPGNPVSCMVTFYQFVRPAILKMMGRENLFLPMVEAVLEEDTRSRPGRRDFIRAVTRYGEGGYTVRLAGDQGSGVLLTLVRANSLMILPEDRGEFRAGEKVRVQLLP